MPWTVIIAERAHRDLRRLSARDREAVLRALERLAVSPGASNLKKLSGGRGEWRLRVGRWRVLLNLDNSRGIVTVSRVLARKDAY
jgi:mRNA interferase RelE/StbE